MRRFDGSKTKAGNNRLTDIEVRNAKPRATPWRLFDGGNLYVVVYPSGRKAFEYRCERGGKSRAQIIAPYGNGEREMGLVAARAERSRLDAMLDSGQDPADAKVINREAQKAEAFAARAATAARRAAAAAAKNEAAREALTVKVAAEAWISEMRKGGWPDRHVAQVEHSLRDHVYPILGHKPVASVEPAHILDLLGGMLADGKVETARKIRQRLDAIFEDAALRHKLPTNPVAMAKRNINTRFKAARKANPEQNFACVPVAEVPQLLRAMRSYVGTPTTRTLLWFVALTACRTGEARFATWDEFTLGGDDPRWQIPARRMKAGRDHHVPLAPVVVEMLRAMQNETGKRAFVFPHPRRNDRPASENAILYALAAIGYKDRMTGHGFRSLFSTLANASQLHHEDVIEAALAHGDEDAIRDAYNKAQRADERKALADLYGDARRNLANWYADELAWLEAGTRAKVFDIRHAVA